MVVVKQNASNAMVYQHVFIKGKKLNVLIAHHLFQFVNINVKKLTVENAMVLLFAYITA